MRHSGFYVLCVNPIRLNHEGRQKFLNNVSSGPLPAGRLINRYSPVPTHLPMETLCRLSTANLLLPGFILTMSANENV